MKAFVVEVRSSENEDKTILVIAESKDEVQSKVPDGYQIGVISGIPAKPLIYEAPMLEGCVDLTSIISGEFFS